jgi:hypothetical protein
MDYIENNQLTEIDYLVNNPFFWDCFTNHKNNQAFLY